MGKREGSNGAAATARHNVVDLKLRVKPPGKNIHRPTVGVVGGIGDELIVEADFCRGGKSVAVIGLDDLLVPGMRQHGREHFPPMPERNADVLEILISQMPEYGDVDLVLGKALSVLPLGLVPPLPAGLCWATDGRWLGQPEGGGGAGSLGGRKLARRYGWSGVCALEAVGPAAGCVVDARDFNSRAAHAVGNDVGRFGYHEFACTGDAAGCAEFRVLREQVLDAVEDVQGDALCGGRVMFGDVRAQGDKIVNGFRRP